MPVETWQCGPRALSLQRTRVMGIINVTPDSFSDGGEHDTADKAIEWGYKLLDDGADILDIGGESTRPGFTAVSVQEEIDRVVPVIKEFASYGALVSVDTRHAEVAKEALDAGALILNDVSGFEDKRMIDLARQTRCGVVIMRPSARHLQGSIIKAENGGSELVREVNADLVQRAKILQEAGIEHNAICIDPGSGFGLNAQQDVALMEQIDVLAQNDYPLLCAVSRKRFVGTVSGVNPAARRDAASLGIALGAAMHGAHIVRVHDVAGTAAALYAYETCWQPTMRTAFIALGSNMGDRLQNLKDACKCICDLPQTTLVRTSSVYETEPAYVLDQAPFANAVIEVKTAMHPFALLQALLDIEDKAGRVRTIPNGARILDLDLLAMEHERYVSSRLMLPHKRIGERDFTVIPLQEILGETAFDEFCKKQALTIEPPQNRVGKITGILGGLQ
ncbi:MAG: dihydropteroate synthase [Coriobacteriales bacterium]|nr:dihydropteroate synthase [Coriobacteriales bacterium]